MKSFSLKSLPNLFITAILLGILTVLVIMNFVVLPAILKRHKSQAEAFTSPKPPVLIYTIVTDPDDPNLKKLGDSIQDSIAQSPTLPPNQDLFRVLVSKDPIGYKIGHGAKITLLYSALSQIRDKSTLVMLVDGYDVIFGAPLTEILAKYQDMVRDIPEKPIVFSAEMYCWPDDKIAFYDVLDPTQGKGKGMERQNDVSPYRFLNSGGFIGPASDILELIAPMVETVDPQTDDQRFYTDRYLRGDSSIQLDCQCNIFQCLANEMRTHLVWDEEQERWCNAMTNTYPSIMHGNGDGKDFLFDTVLKKILSCERPITEEETHEEEQKGI